MANEINRLIEMLYEKVEDARSIALQPGMCKVDRDEMLDLLDELKAQMPGELKRAQELLSAREKFIDDAKQEAERIVSQAEQDAARKLADSEIQRQAREQAGRIVAQAEERAAMLCQMASGFAEDALGRASAAIQSSLGEVNDSRSKFRSVSAAWLQEQREKLREEDRGIGQ